MWEEWDKFWVGFLVASIPIILWTILGMIHVFPTDNVIFCVW